MKDNIDGKYIGFKTTPIAVCVKDNIDGKYIGFKTTPIVVILVKYIY